MKRDLLKHKLQKFLSAVEDIGGDARELIFEEPATEKEVQEVEKALGYALPKEFRNVLLQISSQLEFSWFLSDDFKLPEEFKGIFSGALHWGVEFIVNFNQRKEEWIKECFPDPENEYDAVWHHKFVFQEVGNGDYLAIDLAPAHLGQIVYLSHDDGEGHGLMLAESFLSLLQNWSALGCPGAEDWQWLPFMKEEGEGIDPETANGKKWRKLIGIG